MITLSIPVPGHVQKYLVAKYGTAHTLTKTSLLGQIIFMAIGREGDKNADIKPETHSYGIQVTNWYGKTYGDKITAEQKNTLSIILKKIFREDLVLYVSAALKSGCSGTQAVALFMNEFAIFEDDIKAETLWKIYQRHRPKVAV